MSTDPKEITLDLPPQPATTENKAPIAGAKPSVELLKYGERGVAISSFEDLFRFAKAVTLSGMAPRGYEKPESVIIAVQMGAEVGLPPMSALQNIAVINGRPTLYGDAVPAVCAPLVESYKDEEIGNPENETFGIKVTILRKGRSEPIVRTFTIADAIKAGLWKKAGPWSQYPKRMLLMRARAFAYRDACPDRMRGMLTAEEATEIEPKNVTGTGDLSALE